MSDIVEFGKYKGLFPEKNISTNVAVIREDQKDLLAVSYNNYWASPKFKLRWFVGQAEFTPYHKVRQYLLELRTREDSLESQEYEYNKVKVQYKIAVREYENETDELKKELLGIEAKRLHNGIQSTGVRVRDLYIERQHFLDLIDEFNNSEEGKTADGRRYIDLIGTEHEEKLEKEYWTVRLARQAAMDMAAYGRIGTGNLEAIMQLQPDQQTEALQLAHTVSLAIEKKQNVLREQAAKALQITDAGKMLYIGELDPDLINAAISADRQLLDIANPLQTQTLSQSESDGIDTLSDVYNI